MSATPFGATRTIATAIGGVVVATFAYVGGIAVFEGFVVDAVPYDVPAAVGPVWVAATLAAIGDRGRGRRLHAGTHAVTHFVAGSTPGC